MAEKYLGCSWTATCFFVGKQKIQKMESLKVEKVNEIFVLHDFLVKRFHYWH